MSNGVDSRLPVHLAFYWLGVAEQRPDGIVVRDEIGPYVEGLAEVFERVTVVAYDPPSTPILAEDEARYLTRPAKGNIDLLSLGPKGSWRDSSARYRRVRDLVRMASSRWDLLLLRFDRRAHLVSYANRCPRTVAMVHGYSGAVEEPGLPVAERVRMIPFNLRSRWHLRRLVRRSGLLVTDGEHYMEALGSHAPAKALIRHSIRPERFGHHVADRLNGPAARFLFVGRTTHRKGILEAIEAFAEVRGQLIADAVLDVVGEGSELDPARELSQEKGIEDAVTFHGVVEPGEAMSAFYKAADVLLFLSRSESMPKVVLEAMAHSVLVVSTPVGALPRAFQHRRELLFVDATPSSVVSAVRTLLCEPELRRTMISAGQRVAAETSVEHVVRALTDAAIRRWPELSAGSHRRDRPGPARPPR